MRFGALDADEEEGRPVRIGTPDNGQDIEWTSSGRPEAQLRRGPGFERRIVEPQLGAEGAQIDGFEVEALVTGFDSDGPGYPCSGMPSKVRFSFSNHERDSAGAVSHRGGGQNKGLFWGDGSRGSARVGAVGLGVGFASV